jgi:hypothetical protein
MGRKRRKKMVNLAGSDYPIDMMLEDPFNLDVNSLVIDTAGSNLVLVHFDGSDPVSKIPSQTYLKYFGSNLLTMSGIITSYEI